MVENLGDWQSTINPDDPEYPNVIISNWPAEEETVKGDLENGLPPKAKKWPTTEEWEKLVKRSQKLEIEVEEKNFWVRIKGFA